MFLVGIHEFASFIFVIKIKNTQVRVQPGIWRYPVHVEIASSKDQVELSRMNLAAPTFVFLR